MKLIATEEYGYHNGKLGLMKNEDKILKKNPTNQTCLLMHMVFWFGFDMCITTCIDENIGKVSILRMTKIV